MLSNCEVAVGDGVEVDAVGGVGETPADVGVVANVCVLLLLSINSERVIDDATI